VATLPGQRAQFTWALNQYNLAEDAEQRAHFAQRMAKYIAAAPRHGFKIEEVTQGQTYPAAEVEKYLNAPDDDSGTELGEAEALKEVEQAVDVSNVVRLGDKGSGFVYAYGYRCAPDRLKIGKTEVDTVQRIMTQISTSTPDRPVLFLEIRTHDHHSLERAIQSTLAHRGCKVVGGGTEWFVTNREEVIAIYQFIAKTSS
jgi:T5orf172 domain-containing protein